MRERSPDRSHKRWNHNSDYRRQPLSGSSKSRHRSNSRDRSPKRSRNSPRGDCSHSTSRNHNKKSPKSSSKRNHHRTSPYRSSKHADHSNTYKDRSYRYSSPSPSFNNKTSHVSRDRSPRNEGYSKRVKDEAEMVIHEARIAVGLLPNNKTDISHNVESIPTPKSPPPPSNNRANGDSLVYVPGVDLLDSTDPAFNFACDMSNSSLDRTHGSPVLQPVHPTKCEKQHVDVSSISVDSNSYNIKCLPSNFVKKPSNNSFYDHAGTTSSSSSQMPFPALHLHMSDDGSSPLPPGWDRAPNPAPSGSSDNNNYPHYYYHVKTRITRWDPPVYPWDADPFSQQSLNSNWSNDNPVSDSADELLLDNSLTFSSPAVDSLISEKNAPLDPHSPYNWGLAHRYQVTHDDIEALYNRIRGQMLEKQCQEMIHELAHFPDCPRGPVEHSYAIEIYSLVHNTLREFRDARCQLGRITNDEDLHALTRKLAQDITLKEVHKFRLNSAEQHARVLNIPEAAETCQLNQVLREKMQNYIRKYMSAKGPIYKAPPFTSHHHGLSGVVRASHPIPRPPPPPAPRVHQPAR